MLCIDHTLTILFFFFNDTATTEIYTLSLHDALPIFDRLRDRFRQHAPHLHVLPAVPVRCVLLGALAMIPLRMAGAQRSEEHTSELQSRLHLVCRLLLEKKKKHTQYNHILTSISTAPH